MPESTPPKAPRTLDPDILRLRKQHFQNVMDLKRRRTSTKILQTIIEKRLPALTDEDIAKLLNAIGPKPVTAPLPPRPAPAVAAPQAPRPAQPMPGPVPPRKP